MICLSLADISYQQCRDILEPGTLAEIRLDRMALSHAQIRELFSGPGRLIATFRPGKVSEEERRGALLLAATSGAAYVDLEWETDREFRAELMSFCHTGGCRCILSYHNYEETPERQVLLDIIHGCFQAGAEIAKVACMVRTQAETARMLSLYDHPRAVSGGLLALGMGPLGKITRVAAPLLGAPFTFVAPDDGRETAPGQLDRYTMLSVWEKLGI